MEKLVKIREKYLKNFVSLSQNLTKLPALMTWLKTWMISKSDKIIQSDKVCMSAALAEWLNSSVYGDGNQSSFLIVKIWPDF